MFCRFCGAAIPEDSRFCARCGTRLEPRAPSPWVARLGLKTPYPYAGLLFLAFVVWAVQPRRAPVDYGALGLELELAGEASIPEQNFYRHGLSLVVENRGGEPLGDIPIEFRARIEPAQPVEIVSEFLTRRLVILRDDEVIPLVVVLADELAPGEKRRYAIDGLVTTAPPARIIYEVLAEDSGVVLAALAAPIPGPPPL